MAFNGVATRTRFTSYSHELSATFGFMFIVLVLLWLRTHGVRGKIRIRLDNGLAFCSGSQKKLDQWNNSLMVHSHVQLFVLKTNPIPHTQAPLKIFLINAVYKMAHQPLLK